MKVYGKARVVWSKREASKGVWESSCQVPPNLGFHKPVKSPSKYEGFAE